MAIKEAIKALLFFSEKPIKPFTMEPSKMELLLDELDAEPIIPAPKIQSNVLAKWELATKTSNYSRISSIEMKQLCWVDEIALSKEFSTFLSETHLKRKNTVIRKSSAKGLISALANKWTDINEGKYRIDSLKNICSQNLDSEFLGKVTPYFFSKKGEQAFAKEYISRRGKLGEFFTEKFGIVLPASQYETAVVEYISRTHYEVAISKIRSDREWFYQNILSSGLSKTSLFECLALIVSKINSPSSGNLDDAKDELKEFILTHSNLGDPRLPGSQGNWMLAPISVKKSIIEWLSRSDIIFFFDLFFAGKDDPQGRKQFWLDYAHNVVGSRIVISKEDSNRLSLQLRDLDNKKINTKTFGHFIDDGATAFIMDFGTIKIVEFSEVNNACYFYKEKPNSEFKLNKRDDFWNTKNFYKSDLKNTSIADKYMAHGSSWEGRFTNYLIEKNGGNGIRPKPPGRRS